MERLWLRLWLLLFPYSQPCNRALAYLSCPGMGSPSRREKSPIVRKRLGALRVFSVFTSHVIKTKNLNYSMIKVKNLGYNRWLIYKQSLQESGLCCFSFARYFQKCVTQIYRALYGEAMFVSFWRTQTWRLLSNRNIRHWVLLFKQNFIALELQHNERMFSSSASTVQLAKTKVITHLLTWPTRQPSRVAIFMSRNAKAWKLKRALLQWEEPCGAETLWNVKFL